MSKNKHFLSVLLAGGLLCLSACGNLAVKNLFAEEEEAERAADNSLDRFFSNTENLFAEDAENAAGSSPDNLFSDAENLFAEDAENAAGSSPDRFFSNTESLFAEDAENAAGSSSNNLFSDAENLFAEDVKAENIPHGSIVHGSDSRTFTYTGGTLELPYYAEGSGLGANCGFLLFLDGIPQPYRIESEGSCAYLHRLSLTDKVRKHFSFYLEPVAGKSGETLTLTILSLTPQSFEGTKELPLGTSQNFLENYVSLAFEADAVLTQPAAGSNIPILRNLSVSEEELTPENIKSYLSDGTGTPAASVSELSTHVFQSCSLGEDGTELSHILLGHPDVRYRTALFLDYIPLWYEGSCCVDRNLKSGLASRLDVRLDPGVLDGTHVLSLLSIPLNASDFPDDVLITETWSAILGDTQ